MAELIFCAHSSSDMKRLPASVISEVANLARKEREKECNLDLDEIRCYIKNLKLQMIDRKHNPTNSGSAREERIDAVANEKPNFRINVDPHIDHKQPACKTDQTKEIEELSLRNKALEEQNVALKMRLDKLEILNRNFTAEQVKRMRMFYYGDSEMTADERNECVKLKDEIKSLKQKLLERENLYYSVQGELRLAKNKLEEFNQENLNRTQNAHQFGMNFGYGGRYTTPLGYGSGASYGNFNYSQF